jgi:hypothetical protein
MSRLSFLGRYEKYALALLPVFGVALTSVNQIGRMSFYGVPYELMEFRTVGTVLSGIALTITSAAGLLSVAIAYTRDLQTWWQRAFHHVGLASMLTGPFWIGTIDLSAQISWPSLFFIATLAGAGFMTESYYRSVRSGGDSARDLQGRIERALHVALLLGFLTLAGSYMHGYYSASENTERLFVQGTNDLVAGSFNGYLVVKRYDPLTRTIDRRRTTLLSPQVRLELEGRTAPIGGELKKKGQVNFLDSR